MILEIFVKILKLVYILILLAYSEDLNEVILHINSQKDNFPFGMFWKNLITMHCSLKLVLGLTLRKRSLGWGSFFVNPSIYHISYCNLSTCDL